MDQKMLDIELSFSTWQSSCRDVYSPTICCRREINHKGDCAAGFGSRRVTWNSIQTFRA